MHKYVLTLAFAVLWAGVSPARAQSADDLFGSQTLQRLDLWVNSADWAKLGAEFQTNTYYPVPADRNPGTADQRHARRSD
ncbi:MAG: hypothetical protein Q7R30_14180 [Acidobacteriota bacterium]|nr:hypothetical protein [Acidobacteriota bacterium]